jgi:hypothetical protein
MPSGWHLLGLKFILGGSIPNGLRAKKIHLYLPGDQKSEDEKWNFDLNFCAVCDFASYFLQEVALHVSRKLISIISKV